MSAKVDIWRQTPFFAPYKGLEDNTNQSESSKESKENHGLPSSQMNEITPLVDDPKAKNRLAQKRFRWANFNLCPILAQAGQIYL